ncbi:polysaccharide biosynthesis protein [bacterium]|nr:polysaccharide biosynthesis protein [bacterium]
MGYLITGGTGTLGSCVIRELVRRGEKRIYSMSRDDSKQAEARLEFPGVTYLCGDVTNYEDCRRMHDLVYPTNIVHTAALKHVPACEENPEYAMRQNFIGAVNMHRACSPALKFTQISTDKAVHPIGVLGFTKAMAERHILKSNYGTIVRLGNVINSRGSILQLAAKQLEEHGCIFITDIEMERYWITDQEAANFILADHIERVAVPEMQKRKVVNVIRDAYPDAKFEVIGKKFGEKLDEQVRWEWE